MRVSVNMSCEMGKNPWGLSPSEELQVHQAEFSRGTEHIESICLSDHLSIIYHLISLYNLSHTRLVGEPFWRGEGGKQLGAPSRGSSKNHFWNELWERSTETQANHLVRNTSIQHICTGLKGTIATSVFPFKCYELLGFELRLCEDIMNLWLQCGDTQCGCFSRREFGMPTSVRGNTEMPATFLDF